MAKKRREASTTEADGAHTPEQRRLQSAVDRAADYRHGKLGDGEAESGDEPVRPMEEWRDLVSQRIEDAMRQGLFDNLSGRGKALAIERDPYLPEDQRMAATLLRNNNLSPAWISERKALLAAIDELRADLRVAAGRMHAALDATEDGDRADELRATWTTWLRGWQTRMYKLNDRILVHNLKQPVPHLEIFMLRTDAETIRAGADPAWVHDTEA